MAVFKFKQFSITQDKSPMKVGTDAMMLGAIVGKSLQNHALNSILDIGTGNGVIALMLAQEFPNANIVGIDCYSPATEEASSNFSASPFSQQLSAIHEDFLSYEPAHKFDLIVSNPPYYDTQMLPKASLKRLAKHENAMTVEKLIGKAAKILSKNGELWLILPPQKAQTIIDDMIDSMHLKTTIHLYGSPTNHSRTIIACSPTPTQDVLTSSFIIRDENGKYTPQYKELTKAFHGRRL